MRSDNATHRTASGSVESSQDDSNRICIDNMNRFPQICVREQYICSDQFTRVPRHSAIGGTSELGQSEDWRLPVGAQTTFGQIVFTGDSLIVVHALPAYHPRSVIAAGSNRSFDCRSVTRASCAIDQLNLRQRFSEVLRPESNPKRKRPAYGGVQRKLAAERVTAKPRYALAPGECNPTPVSLLRVAYSEPQWENP